jgi:hypothetical protein
VELMNIMFKNIKEPLFKTKKIFNIRSHFRGLAIKVKLKLIPALAKELNISFNFRNRD